MIQKLLNKPLMIAPQSLETLANVEWFASEEKIAYNIYSDVAVIPVHGLLTKRSEFFSSFFGTTSYEEIHELISLALDDAEVNSILLDIDSPGGEVSGLFDLADFIYESRNTKPIYAIANDSAFSAAYAIASAATKIFVNRTSGVGSIGVIATHVDISEYDKKEGIKYTTIFAGDRKNDLSPHEPISDEAISDLQKEVDRLYGMFIALVARNRNVSTVQVRATQAALYFGADSVSLGFADEIADFQKCLQIIGEEKMTEDIELYKAEILEISKLCKLAHTENKLAEFIEQNLSPDEVKEKLLACTNTQEEIRSMVYYKEAAQENPVIAAAKARSK
ncbi:MAG: S49 family peptidase [Holosporaceae bacterium]|nr:S49 family peptidase [Holosporaceae bacterium]